ncbi:HlyD family secretion protein [Desulfovibrio inopinatus]|uniref:HlyD family secretion protein n=1 Tax=Desulfovibrio inopinatus TaxID=102109 RepID=UPI000424AB48|nr:HlyD family secretion protein [Desulfovibrio inopinatus]
MAHQEVSPGTEPSSPDSTQSNNTQPSKKPRRRITGIVLVILALAAVGACIPLYLHAISHESTDDAFIEAHVVLMSPRVPGHVFQVFVEDNQAVKQGDELLRIDPRDYQAALDASLAAEKAAEADVLEAEAQVATARSSLKQAQADLEYQRDALHLEQANLTQAQAAYERDAADLTRYRSLARSKSVAVQDVDHASTASTISQAKMNAAKRQMETQSDKIVQSEAAINVAEGSLSQAMAQVKARQADLDKARAETEQARLDLSHTHIVAPCSGYVTKKSVEAGSYVQVGQGLLSIVQSDVWVVANFKETQLTDMRPGQQVDIEVDVYPDVTFHGRVDSIQRGTGARFSLLPPENATGNFVKVTQRIPVKIVFDQDENTSRYVLAPGMSTVPVVDITDTENASLAAAGFVSPDTVGEQHAEVQQSTVVSE